MLNMNKTQLPNISRTSSVFHYFIIDAITIVAIMLKTLVLFVNDNLNVSNQIANVCKSTNYQLYKI